MTCLWDTECVSCDPHKCKAYQDGIFWNCLCSAQDFGCQYTALSGLSPWQGTTCTVRSSQELHPCIKNLLQELEQDGLHFLPPMEETNVLPLPASLSFATEPTQFDIFNNFRQTCYSFPKSWFTVWNRKFSRAENPHRKKKLTWKNSEYLGNCLLQLKNKVKSKLDGDKEGSATEPDKPKHRCSPASASQQPSTATLWEQETPEQLQGTGSQISPSWITQNTTEY